MANTPGTILKHRRSSTAGSIPTTGNIELSELAVNTADGYIYLRRKNDALFTDVVVRIRGNSLTGSAETFSFSTALISASANQTVDTFSALEYRTSKYVIQMTYDGDYQSTEILLMHDGTDVYITEYATIQTGLNLGVISAVIDGDDVLLRVSPTYTNTTIEGYRTSVAL